MSLDEVRERLERAAILLDFDGTLAPIVPRPEDARPGAGAADVLAALVPRVALLAVITGRPEPFVRGVLEVEGLEVVGLYGLEGASPFDARAREDVIRVVAAERGVHLEDKGPTLAVHLRLTADPDAVAERVRVPLRGIADRYGLDLFEGKRVLELAPPGGRKGLVVERMIAHASAEAALYAGDDLPDLDAFATLDTLSRETALASCRVAVTGSDTPTELVVAADIVVDESDGLLELLRTL